MGTELAYHVVGPEFEHQHPTNWVVAHRTLIPHTSETAASSSAIQSPLWTQVVLESWGYIRSHLEK